MSVLAADYYTTHNTNIAMLVALLLLLVAYVVGVWYLAGQIKIEDAPPIDHPAVAQHPLFRIIERPRLYDWQVDGE